MSDIPAQPSLAPSPAQIPQSNTVDPTTFDKLEDHIKNLEQQTHQLEGQRIKNLQPEPTLNNQTPVPSTSPAVPVSQLADQAGWPASATNGFTTPIAVQDPSAIPTFDTPAPQPVSNADKERKDQQLGSPTPEAPLISEKTVDVEPPPELKEWIKPKPSPQTLTLPKPIEDKFSEILLQSSTIPKPDIELPVTRSGFEKGFHAPIISSFRWLATWCKRVIMMAPTRVFFKKQDSAEPSPA